MGLPARELAAIEVLPGIVRQEGWDRYMARLRRNAALGDRGGWPEPENFQKDDLVSVRREILLGGHHIPNGSLGVITVDRGNLYDVRFDCDPRVAITLCRYDLAAVD